ncbi:MAG: FtsX-like permease family protein [Bacteroidota bacterium]
MIKHLFTLMWNRRKKNFLLFLEIFVSFLILFAVLSFVTFNIRNYNEPLGYNISETWMIYQSVDEETTDTLAWADTKKRLRQELLAMPEIEAVSFMSYVTPYGNSNWATGHDDNGFELFTFLAMADEHYADAANLNIIEGRWFEESDKNAKYPPVVISKKMRDETFKDNPVIDSIYVVDNSEQENRIIGVIDHYKYNGNFQTEDPITFTYKPIEDIGSNNINIRVVPNSRPELEEEVNALVTQITKKQNFRIERLDTEQKLANRSTWIPMIALLSISGFLILNIALGLFGVVWFNVNKRRGEIGLRRTVGATKASITRQFITEILLVALIGVLAGAFFSVQVPILKVIDIESINFIYAMLLSTGIIVLIVLLCTFYPSYQASLIAPAVALHEE